MPRLQRFFECVARALTDTSDIVPVNAGPLSDSLMEVVRSSFQQFKNELSEADLQVAIRELASTPPATVELSLEDAIAALTTSTPAVHHSFLTAFLELMQPVVQQALRRPGDAAGHSVPQQLTFSKPEDWLIFFPDRLAQFKPGDTPVAYDDWQLADLRGLGPFGEAWQGAPESRDGGSAFLKLITDQRAAVELAKHEDHFRRILDIESSSGLVPLRSVYMLTDPPCLEFTFVTGYDASGLIRDWRWRDENPKPEQAALIVKRAAKIVGGLHLLEPAVVHRGLKPSNILLHPTSEGKVTIWISDLGWGEISSSLHLEGVSQFQAKRQARRGALASLYASPEQQDGRPPDPRDDVYALGVIWYQLLKRDLMARAPEGYEWALPFRQHGLTDGHARLLASCVDPNPEYRPANGMVLAAQIDANVGKSSESGSRTFLLKDTSTMNVPLRRKSGKSGPEAKASVPVDRPKAFQNSIGMNFVLIEPGSFVMGSPPEEKGRHSWEGPLHTVRLSRPFYLGVHPVTQSQFHQLMGKNPSHHTRSLGGGPNHPVEQVTWQEAIDFCHKLMEIPDESMANRIYRLPTEAEWEYACRAGTTTAYSFGETVALNQVHFFGLSAATWAKSASTAGKTAKVDDRPPNRWGLHDMHGNVLEWCHDWWGEDYYAESPAVDPPGPAAGGQRVVRGGSFSQFATECRSAARLGRAPSSRLNTIGFRVALTVPGT